MLYFMKEDKDRGMKNVDNYANGDAFIHSDKTVEMLMEFLTRYVCKVHFICFVRQKLMDLDLII